MATVPATPAAETTDQRVARLLRTWRAEAAYLSSTSQIQAHAAYQELMTLGAEALPALFRDLEQTSDGHLSKALAEITGAHPVSAEDRGKIHRIAEAWLNWARENGHRW
jgi:hypothetical protein